MPAGICGPLMVTATPGSGTPSLSRTTPLTSPVDWANASGAATARQAMAAMSTRRRIGITPSLEPRMARGHSAYRIESIEGTPVDTGRILLSFEADQILETLAPPHHPKSIFLDQHLGRTPPEVVVGGHRETVGARLPYPQEIPLLDGWEETIPSNVSPVSQ